MSRLIILAVAVVSLAGAAHAEDTPMEDAGQGGRLLWLEPLSTALGLAYTASPSAQQYDNRLHALSAGYAHPLDARRSLATELFVFQEVGGCRTPTDTCYASTAARASVGLAYSFGGSPGRGFLLQPRLILGYSRRHPGRGDPNEFPSHPETPGSHGFSLQAGLDVGYQWRLGPVYLAIVGGLAAGVSTGIEGFGPFLIVDGNDTVEPSLDLALGLNLHLLRVGFAF
jgi:opacity protein-like surface antigen